MTIGRYIIAWAVIMLNAVVAIMTLNGNPDVSYINMIGIFLIFLQVKFYNHIYPAWLRDYFRVREMDDEFGNCGK